jgi:uncharacterized delta-60 repeat protein
MSRQKSTFGFLKNVVTALSVSAIWISAAAQTSWAQNKFAIAKYNQTGDLDLGFGCPMPGPTCTGQPGAKFTDFTGANETANGIIQEFRSRKPVAVGYATDSGGNRQFAVARYMPDGREDLTFGGGKVVTAFLLSSYATSIAEEFSDPRNVKLVVAGTTWPSACCNDARIAIARYDGGGFLDPGFGLSGRVITNILATSNEFATSVAVDTNVGKVWIAGGADGKILVARYTNNGQLDSTFGCDPANRPCTGWNVDDLPKVTEELAYDLVLDGSGMIIAGKGKGAAGGHFILARYTSNGLRDTNFGCAAPPCSGFIVTDFGAADVVGGSSDEGAQSLAIQGLRVVAGGYVSPGPGTRHFALAGYTFNGVLDTTYGCPALANCSGKVVTSFHNAFYPNLWDAAIYGIAATPWFGLVAVGHAIDGGVPKIALARYDRDGNLDPNFGCTGLPCGTEISVVGSNPMFGSIAVDIWSFALYVAGGVQ